MRFQHECEAETFTVHAGKHKAQLSLHRLLLPVYEGPPPQSTWSKPVVGPPSRPFAELQVVDGLEMDGWLAAWVYRPGKFLSTWEPRVFASLPPEALALHDRIGEEAGAKAGCWDVFAWRGGVCLFAELKRARSPDRIRESQLTWREAALRLGVSTDAFVVVEWSSGTVWPTSAST